MRRICVNVETIQLVRTLLPCGSLCWCKGNLDQGPFVTKGPLLIVKKMYEDHLPK